MVHSNIRHEQIAANIWILHNFWSVKECTDFIAQSEKTGFTQASINTDFGARVVPGVRNNYRIMYKDLSLSENLWQRLQPYAPPTIGKSIVIGLNEMFRVYRYTTGQIFKRHRDQSFIRNDTESSYYTFMIYLNDSFTGGETTFGKLSIKPESGSALIFLHSLEHEGAKVTSGIKYVLRTDIMYKL